MSLASYVRIVARGKGRARSLTQSEAREAMALILAGKAAPEAVGALLMVLRLRGETAEEIAGFTAALRAHTKSSVPASDLDWPSYAAGRTRGAPVFLLAARLLGQAGYTVSIHGWNSHQAEGASVRDQIHLAGPNVTYTPLESVCPAAFDLLKLRDTFGLRSCINTVLRMWNPSQANASLQGVFHPSYRSLQAQAGALLGQQNLSIIKGGGGEFERYPAKVCKIYGLRDGAHIEESISPLIHSARRRLRGGREAVNLAALWHGQIADPFAVATVTGTVALALWTLKAVPSLSEAEQLAQELWTKRHHKESLSA